MNTEAARAALKDHYWVQSRQVLMDQYWLSIGSGSSVLFLADASRHFHWLNDECRQQLSLINANSRNNLMTDQN